MIKKLIVVLCTLLMASGTIYASAITPVPLSKWYEQYFQKEGYKTPRLDSEESIDSFVLEASQNLTTNIEYLLDNQMEASNANIAAHQQDMTSQIGQTVADLEGVTFDDYVESMKIKETIDLEINNILAEIFSE